MRTLKVVGIVILVLGLLGGLAGSVLLGREEIPETSDFRLDLATLEALALDGEGDLPVAIHHEVVAEVRIPRAAVFAGLDFSPHTMVHGVHQVLYPDDRFVLIDAAFGREQLAAMSQDSQYEESAFERVKRALVRADVVVLTHEHFDHIDGLAGLEDPAWMAERLVMNKAQKRNPNTRDRLPAALLDAVRPWPGDAPWRVAPGVVLVPAPGHSPGSQLVYVRLEGGDQWLFVGDVAWHMDALRELHYRPRLVTDWILGEDRAAVMAQFRTLHELLEVPGLQIVVSHDADQRHALVRAGQLIDGLSLPRPGTREDVASGS